MPAGRPRTVSLQPEQMIELGKEMVAWVVENEPVHLCQFYCILKGYTDSEWRAMKIIPEFLPYYEQAIKLVGIQYLYKDSKVADSIKQRWQRIYFKEMRDSENELVVLKAEAGRKNKEEDDAGSAKAIAQAISDAINKS